MHFMRCVLAYWAYIEYGDDDCLLGCERAAVIQWCLRWGLLQQLPDPSKLRVGVRSPMYTRFTRRGRALYALSEVLLVAWACKRRRP